MNNPDGSSESGDTAVDPASSALVVIDLQRAIVDRPAAPTPSAVVVSRCARLAEAARQVGQLVVAVRVSHPPGGATALHQPVDRPASLLTPSPGWDEIVTELKLSKTDVLVTKRQWGAFYGTDLDLQLRRRRIDTIVLCGISTEVGVESTARDAYERGYRIVFAVDAMTSTSAEGHDAAVATIFPRLGHVTTASVLLADLERGWR